MGVRLMLGLGLRLGLAQRPSGSAAFDPASLFSGGKAGVFYMPGDITSMRQGTTAGSTAAAVGSNVGYLADKSPNGSHATLPNGYTNPVLRQSGTFNWLEFTRTLGALRASFTMTMPLTRISLIRMRAWNPSDRIMAAAVTPNTAVLIQTGTTPSISIYAGTFGPANNGLALNTWGVLTEIYNAPTSKLAVNNGAYTTGDTGSTAPDGITLGNCQNGAGSAGSSVDIAAVLEIEGVLPDSDIAKVRTLFGAPAGLTL